ncbi:MAG: hypothetical protein CSA81_04960 [Acidobacteria bacterium]|nr:MAG: hypothetical protein CSA81_04960 [Acidobacteriota bacterium]
MTPVPNSALDKKQQTHSSGTRILNITRRKHGHLGSPDWTLNLSQVFQKLVLMNQLVYSYPSKSLYYKHPYFGDDSRLQSKKVPISLLTLL